MNEVEGVVSEVYAPGGKPCTEPGVALLRLTRARREPLGFIDQDAALRGGSLGRGASLDHRCLLPITLDPDLAVRVVGFGLGGLPASGANDLHGASGPTTAGRAVRGFANDRARGRGEGKGW